MEPTNPSDPRPPVHETGLDVAELDLHGGPGFWDEARRIAGASGLGALVEQVLRRGSPPRLWAVVDEPAVTATRVAAALAIARELSRQGENVLVVDADDRHPDLTRWAGRFEQEGWIDILRYGASLAASSIPLPWEGRGGRLVGIGSYLPVSAEAPEVERLLRRLRSMADDIVVCLPLAPESAAWLAAADLRLLCWDRHRRSRERTEELARQMGEGPRPEIVAFGPATAAYAPPAQPPRLDEAILRAADPLAWQRRQAEPEPASPAAEPAAKAESTPEPESEPVVVPAKEVEALLAGLAEAQEAAPEGEESGATDEGEEEIAEEVEEEIEEEVGDELAEEIEAIEAEIDEDLEEKIGEELPEPVPPAEAEDVLVSEWPEPPPEAEEPLPAPLDFPVPERRRGTARPFWIAAAVLVVAAGALGAWYWSANRPAGRGAVGAGGLAPAQRPAPEVSAPAEPPGLEQAVAAAIDTAASVVTSEGAAADTIGSGAAAPPPAAPSRLPAAASGLDLEPVGGRGWALWVSSVPDSVAAGQEVARLRHLGLRAQWRAVELPERGRYFRVYVGSFATRDEAEQAAPEAMRRLRNNWAMPARFEGP